MCSLANLCGSLQICENIFRCDNCCTFENRSSSRGDRSDCDGQGPTTSTLRHGTIRKAIKKSLKTRYEKIKLPSLPWLDNVDISIKRYTKLALEVKSVQGEITTQSIELDNLFDVIDKKKPKRILIESQPGYGKTTLAHKIISDWVKEEKYVRRFKFAILIILRDLKKKTLQNELAKLVGAKNWNVINNDDTLLILDGLDEVSEKTRKNLVEILYDANNEYNVTIVTTSRIGLSNFTQEEIQSVFKGVSVQTDFWCKKITILGINEENREEFLENFVDDVDKDNTMRRLREIMETRDEMFTSPLLLILLVCVMSENDDVKIETNTDLYKSIVDCMVRRSVSKTNPDSVNVNISLFDRFLNDSSVFHESKILLYKFGKMSINKILENNLHFKANSDTKAIHYVGFLLKHETRRKLKLVVHYEGFHLSILEFAAAFYFWEELRLNEYQFSVDLFKKFEKICLKRSDSLILPFLSGLAGSEISYLFGLFSLYRISDWFNSNLINTVLRECSENIAVSELSNFLPGYFSIFNENTHSKFNDLIDRYSLIANLDINLRYLSKIKRPVTAKFLSINVEDDDIIQAIEINAENFHFVILSLNIHVKQVLTSKLRQILIRLDLSTLSDLSKYISQIINSIMRKEFKFLNNIIFELMPSYLMNTDDLDLVKSYMRANSKVIFRFVFSSYFNTSSFVQFNFFSLLNFNVEYSSFSCDFTNDYREFDQLQLTLK